MTTTVSLVLAADFADMFEVRGGVRRAARGHALAPKRLERALVLAYVGEDEAFRESIIELQPTPDDLELAASRSRGRWRVALGPGKPAERPMLPDWLGRVRLEGLRVGDATATLAFERKGSVTAFALLGQYGELNVTMAASESPFTG